MIQIPPLWAREASEQFWTGTVEADRYPRDVRRAVTFNLPVGVVMLPRLRVAAVEGWLHRQGIACQAGADRRLRACLVARGGHGLLFVDGTDPEDEQRFSIAHELAHFLRDYWNPRQRTLEKLGPGILQVVDGLRSPTAAERVDALLAGTPIGTYTHLMERTPNGHFADRHIGRAEREADALAYEILAPARAVAEELSARQVEGSVHAAQLLVGKFGLPRDPARSYAAMLYPQAPASLARRLWAVQ